MEIGPRNEDRHGNWSQNVIMGTLGNTYDLNNQVGRFQQTDSGIHGDILWRRAACSSCCARLYPILLLCRMWFCVSFVGSWGKSTWTWDFPWTLGGRQCKYWNIFCNYSTAVRIFRKLCSPQTLLGLSCHLWCVASITFDDCTCCARTRFFYSGSVIVQSLALGHMTNHLLTFFKGEVLILDPEQNHFLVFPDANAFHFLLAGGPKVSIVLAAMHWGK